MFSANLEVDPLLFRRYGVTSVPTFVYARGVNRTDAALSEGLNDGASVERLLLGPRRYVVGIHF